MHFKNFSNRSKIIYADFISAGLPDSDGDGLTDGGADSCGGDSGGPLVCLENSKMSLYGIVSWGAECGAKGYGGVYANIFKEKSWISETLANFSIDLKKTDETTTPDVSPRCDISDLPSNY